MDAIGGNLNAFTAKECTCFYAKVLDEHLPRAADMLSDLVRNSKFDEADIEREKGVVCEEILMTEDSPEDVAHETLCSLLYENTPLANPILGTKESVRAFTRETLMDYMGRHYMPNNIVISCAGHFERQRLMDELNRRFLGGGLGAWAGMYAFRHKTLHRHFSVGMPVMLAVQLLLGAVVQLWL